METVQDSGKSVTESLDQETDIGDLYWSNSTNYYLYSSKSTLTQKVIAILVILLQLILYGTILSVTMGTKDTRFLPVFFDSEQIQEPDEDRTTTCGDLNLDE